MKVLEVLFRGLKGGHIPKSRDEMTGCAAAVGGQLVLGIDCCDVIDTCCDTCDE